MSRDEKENIASRYYEIQKLDIVEHYRWSEYLKNLSCLLIAAFSAFIQRYPIVNPYIRLPLLLLLGITVLTGAVALHGRLKFLRDTRDALRKEYLYGIKTEVNEPRNAVVARKMQYVSFLLSVVFLILAALEAAGKS